MSAALAAVFFLSGAVAVVYEVLWQRRFTVVLGAGAPATAAVLAAYFAGLGAGSLALGARARRWRPLRAYAALEVLVAAGALAVGPLSGTLEPRAASAFVALALPTFCMGGTLPALAQLAEGVRRRLGISAGLLYVVNTAGGALGALAVPFLLLPVLGAAGTVVAGVAANLAIAGVAAWMDRGFPAAPPPLPADPEPRLRSFSPTLGYAFLSGFISFALQVLWNRAFAQVHENSVHSFALVVAVFILALAAGGQIARVALRRGADPDRLLGRAWLGSAVLVASAPAAFVRMTDGLAYLAGDVGSGLAVPRLLALAAAVVLPAGTLIGVGLPALMERAGATQAGGAGTVMGRLLAGNVVGCVLGALAGGFLLPEMLGLWRSMLCLALVLAAAGAWRMTTASQRRLRTGLALALAAVAWAGSGLDWPRVRVASQDRLLAVSEGPHGIVAVVEGRGSRRLKLNNHYALGGSLAAGDERMQAHVPLLLHPRPRRVAMLGLGTGITAGGALFHPVETLATVELVPEVVTAARTWFAEANQRVLAEPRTTVVLGDARRYVRGHPSQLDVVVGDLVVPWRPGEGALLTVEHFRAVRRSLAPGGIFCQWLPLFQLSEPDLRVLVGTFLSVFPQAELWRGDFSADASALALVGGDGFRAEPSVVTRRMREMRPDPSNAHLADPRAFWMYRVGALEPGDAAGAGLRVNSDDRPWVELDGPRHHGGRVGGDVFTGRRLQSWLAEVGRRSTREGLGADVGAGREAGELLLELSLCLAEGNGEWARAARAGVGRRLSPQAFAAIFGEGSDGPP